MKSNNLKTRKIVDQLLDIQLQHYTIRSEIRDYFKDEKVLLSMLEYYSEPINEIPNLIINDILEVEDHLRSSVELLINHIVYNDKKYKDTCVDLIINQDDLAENITKVSTHTWFIPGELLEEHKNNYPSFKEECESEED